MKGRVEYLNGIRCITEFDSRDCAYPRRRRIVEAPVSAHVLADHMKSFVLEPHMVYDANGEALLKEPVSKKDADAEAYEYRYQAGIMAYVARV